MGKNGEEHMDWRDILKETVGVTDEKDIADLTDMEIKHENGRDAGK